MEMACHLRLISGALSTFQSYCNSPIHRFIHIHTLFMPEKEDAQKAESERAKKERVKEEEPVIKLHEIELARPSSPSVASCANNDDVFYRFL